MTNKPNTRGFSLIGVLVAVLVIVLLAGGGWYVWQKNKDDNGKQSNDSSSQTANNQQDGQKREEKPADPTEGGKYLVISEWGVKIPLDESIKKAYYTFRAEDSVDRVALYDATFDETTNANGISCGGQYKYQFYSISRVKPENLTAVTEGAEPTYKEFPFTDEYLFGGLGQHQAAPYCASLNPNGAYQEDQMILEMADKKESAFDEAFRGMRLIN